MLADGFVILSLGLSVFAAGLFAYDAIWAQGARFQRDNAESKKKTLEELIEAETTSVNSLPDQYTKEEKGDMIRKFKEEWEPRLNETKKSLEYWDQHPKRVHQYALIGVGVIAVASILQGIAYFAKP